LRQGQFVPIRRPEWLLTSEATAPWGQWMMSMTNLPEPTSNDMTRIPGLYRRWELAELILPGQFYHIEAAGHADDGTPLFAVFKGVDPDGAGPVA